MTKGRARGRDSAWLLWFVAACGSGLALWAACTDFGTLSASTCAAPPARVAALAPAAAAPLTHAGSVASPIELACSR
jgi:hypothetical protein